MIVNLTLRPIEELKNITIIGTMNNFITDLILRYIVYIRVLYIDKAQKGIFLPSLCQLRYSLKLKIIKTESKSLKKTLVLIKSRG